MDNVTHTLTGLALARSGLNRLSPRATLLLLISANAPDIDIVALARGPLNYFEAHRGYTHSLICLPVLAAVCVVVGAVLGWRRLPWITAWLLCCIGVASHLLLDWTNSYGIRLLLPFSSRWLHLDLNGLYDIWILVILAFAAMWPLFSGLVSREIGARSSKGRSSAIAALSFFLLFDLGRAALHSRTISELQALLWDGAAPVSTAALPESFSPFRWRSVVETSAAYHLLDTEAFVQLDPPRAEVFYKPELTQALQVAKTTEPFRFLIYFSRFPVWSQQPVVIGTGEGQRVALTDLRFGTPDAGSFHSIALENDKHMLLGSWFTFGSGQSLGWGHE
jgi:inner membrane protein